MSLLLAQAAVNDANIHFDKLYSYRIPSELAGRVFPGSMVLVPFGRGSKARMACWCRLAGAARPGWPLCWLSGRWTRATPPRG